MNKSPKVVIKVAKVLAPILGSRDVIDSLKSYILKSNEKMVVLDFKDVQFISRSAAHELLLIKEELSQKNKELSFENTNDDIAEMLRVVAANRALPKSEKIQFRPEKININSLKKEVLA
ncbi:MAG: STAS domain-containing protein [Candidatus Pacebacteria bacterium]|nr:STAS domain-containing protein [Candidatus Paceibacterota bacterium]